MSRDILTSIGRSLGSVFSVKLLHLLERGAMVPGTKGAEHDANATL